jgi:hypothetical protein
MIALLYDGYTIVYKKISDRKQFTQTKKNFGSKPTVLPREHGMVQKPSHATVPYRYMDL